MADDPQYTVGDTAPNLTGTVDANMTGATAVLHVKRPDKTVVSREVEWTDEDAGDWTLGWETGDLNQVGRYDTELEVTYSTAKTQTFWKPTDGGWATSFYVRDQYA